MKTGSLGDRMKWYERQYAKDLMPLIPICARMDGRAFHTFTKGLGRPYDQRLTALMVATTKYLVETAGAVVGYVQSDEISLVWYVEDFDSEVFFGGDHSKMVSILASKTTAYFNKKLAQYMPEKAEQYADRDDSPEFDARVWSVPTQWEATNYLIWREQDATRNSITMAAQAYYSHNELHKKSSSEKHEMLYKKGVNWNDYPDGFKRGTYVQKRTTERPFTIQEIDKLPAKHAARNNPALTIKRQEVAIRSLPPLAKVVNRSEVIFDGAEPQLKGLE